MEDQSLEGLTHAQPVEAVRIPTPGSTVLAVTQPDLLEQLEPQVGLGGLLSDHEWGTRVSRANNAELLANSPGYASLVQYLDREVTEATRGETTLRAEGLLPRRFDTRWLRSADARFELTGVLNRVDRMDFDRTTCGEIRMIYRLAYRRADLRPAVHSRLPFTLAAIYDVLGAPGRDGYSGCVAAAQRFQVDRPLATREAFLAWLRERFDATNGARFRFRQLEVNAQVIRVPSESAPELGGHAEYLLRVMKYAPTGPGGRPVRLEPVALENTPDVSRLSQDPALKRELVDWLVDNAGDVDRGVVQIPERFLAREATSFTTHGSNRRANHPFTQVLSQADLSRISFGGMQNIRSAAGFIERLDNMTCQGCHQSGSVAGFHLLGHDRAASIHALNAVRLAISAHLKYDLERRNSYQYNLVRRAAPETRRPLSYAPFRDRAVPAGSPCLVPATRDANFRTSWGCEAGLSCKVVTDGNVSVDVGMCVRPASESVGGDPCMSGALHETVARPRETTVGETRFGCGNLACLPPIEGTPAGLCIGACAPGNRAYHPDEICAFNGGASFDACAASGNFAACLDGSTTRGLRTACDDDHPCREDYICQRFFEPTASGFRASAERRGFCVPTYFLFQLRLDGHPAPR
jgi:hypothetical protein